MSSQTYQSPWRATSDPSNSFTEFGDRYAVHEWALPFRGRDVDPIGFMADLGTYLDNRPPSCQRVGHNFIRDHVANTESWKHTRLEEMAMLIHGWWLGGTASRSRYYCNPDYPHRHPVSDIATGGDERRELFQKATSLGLLTPSDIAPACGYTSDVSSNGSSVTKAAYRIDFPWSSERDAGRDRLARTWKTISHWGYTYTQIGSAFDYNRRRVGEMVSKRASDFQPPEDPTTEVDA